MVLSKKRKRGGQNDKCYTDKIRRRFVCAINTFLYGYLITSDFISGDFFINDLEVLNEKFKICADRK